MAARTQGKMIFVEISSESAFHAMTGIRLNHGDDTVKQLLVDQQPVFSRDVRQITEGLVRGRYAVALGVLAPVLTEFRSQGIGQNVKMLDLPDADYVPGYVTYPFNRAAHPSAAKLFLNWFLTKEAQTVYAKTTGLNSRRADVEPADAANLPRPGRTYNENNREEVFLKVVETQKFIGGLVGAR